MRRGRVGAGPQGGSTAAKVATRPSGADAEAPELDMADGVTCWTAEMLDRQRSQAEARGDDAADALLRRICFTIDLLGLRSQRAQGINAPLTTVARLHESKTYRLYLLVQNRRGVGVLKMGVKKLFVEHPTTHALVEVDPLCVLDFFVDEGSQRKGLGRALYEHMLRAENITRPEVLAIDRPSPKLLAFMARHYGLQNYAPQVNNFVVFDRFFHFTTITERGHLRRLPSSNHLHDDKPEHAAGTASFEGKPRTGALIENKSAALCAARSTSPRLGQDKLSVHASAFVSGLRGGGSSRAQHEEQYKCEALQQRRLGGAGKRTTVLF